MYPPIVSPPFLCIQFLCCSYALDVIEPMRVSALLLRPMLRVCLQEEEFAVNSGGGVRHRPEVSGYRPNLMDDVRAAAAAFAAAVAPAAPEDSTASAADDDAAACMSFSVPGL
jgi:hypothetical protein